MHLAQLDIALPLPTVDSGLAPLLARWRPLRCSLALHLPAPLTEPELAGFVAALEPANALADFAPGTIATVADAGERPDHLRRHGPTEYAFTLRSPLPAPGGSAVHADDAWLCRA